jgi:hypothetical protein
MTSALSAIGGAVLIMGIAGCTAHPEPIIDPQGVNMVAYQADLQECTGLSEQISTGKGVAKGTAGGAAVGAATGAISGSPARGAGYGAIWGATSSGLKAERDKQNVVKRCLRYRGYMVLN